MVAEDDDQMRTVLARFFRSLGYAVTEAGDGDTAIALARREKPDIMLLDISMPGKSGLEVLKELSPEMPGTGFIMVTGNMEEKTACACLTLGAFDYVSKPVNLEALAHTINARLLIQRPA
jgi:DNA-binding response OmpR family regulator